MVMSVGMEFKEPELLCYPGLAIKAHLAPTYFALLLFLKKKNCKSDCLPEKLKKKILELGGRNGNIGMFNIHYVF